MEQNKQTDKDMSSHPDSTDSSNEEEKASLGMAGAMAKAFIHSPLSPLLFFGMLSMGIMGLILTPRQEDPQISVPMVDIFVAYPGASSEQVSGLAIEPLQRILSEIPDVKHVYGVSEHGQGMVTVQFKVGQELEKSIFKIHDKLASYQDSIPPGVSPPMVKPKGIDDVPVVALTLWSEELDDGSLRTLAFDVLQRLKEIRDTGQGFVVGGRVEQMRVDISPERLTGFGISLQQIARILSTANAHVTTGNVESADGRFLVYSGSFLRTPSDVGNLVIGMHKGVPVYIRDIAKVTLGPESAKKMATFYTGAAYRYNQHSDTDVPVANAVPAVTIGIAKKIGTNGVAVANDILAQVELMKGNMIPENVHVEVTRDYGKSANNKVNSLIKKLFIATAAVTVLVFFSLGWRPAVVVTLVIPVVILMTVFSAYLLGFTIDRVSLFALIFSIGILVDDAIVVMENIYRRWLLKGDNDADTAIDAVREVGNPTILATFTVVAALLPMGFVSGMMGPYMMPIPALGSVAMIISLFAAFIFTPWLAMVLKPSMQVLKKGEESEHAVDAWLEKFYRRVLTPLITDSKKGMLFLVGLIVAFILAMSMFYTNAVEVKMLPLDNKSEFNVFIDMPEGTALPVTANLTYQLAEALRKLPEVTALQTYVGTSQPFDFNGMVRHYYLRSQPWQADIHLQLKEKADRHRSSHEIALEARRLIQKIAKEVNSPAKLTVVEMPPGPPVLQSIVAEVYGPDDETRKAVVAKLTELFETAKILDDVDNYIAEPHDIYHFIVDTEKAVRKGVNVDTINQTLTMAMSEFKLGDIKRERRLEPTYLIMQVPLEVRSQLSQLYDLPVPTMDQQSSIPLSELGRFVRIPQDPVIYHKNLRRVEYVVGEPVGIHVQDGDEHSYTLSSPIYGILEIEKLMDGYTTPDGVQLVGQYADPPKDSNQSGFEWTGEWTVTYETFRDMGIAFAVAMILIYILVVGLFGNFLVPAIIMAPIPLTLLGIVPGHWIAGAEFTATSMIGWIALAGIIVRNSILLVDYSIFELKQGTPIQDAVILACKTRTRPIMITAFALVGGSSVILSDPIFQGMAVSLLSGVLVSTVLTLIVIPLGCISGGNSLRQAAGLIDTHVDHNDDDSKQQTTESKSLWASLAAILMMVFYVLRAIVIMIIEFFKGWFTSASNKSQTSVVSPVQATKTKSSSTSSVDTDEPQSDTKKVDDTDLAKTDKETTAVPAPVVVIADKTDNDDKVEAVSGETKPAKKPDATRKAPVKKAIATPKTSATKKTTATSKTTEAKKTSTTKRSPAKKTTATKPRGIRLKQDLADKDDKQKD